MSGIQPTRGRSVEVPASVSFSSFQVGIEQTRTVAVRVSVGLMAGGRGAADGAPRGFSAAVQWSLSDAARHCTLTRARAVGPDRVPSKRVFPRLSRFAAAFPARMLRFGDYSVCFQACVTELADLLFSLMMSADL